MADGTAPFVKVRIYSFSAIRLGKIVHMGGMHLLHTRRAIFVIPVHSWNALTLTILCDQTTDSHLIFKPMITRFIKIG